MQSTVKLIKGVSPKKCLAYGVIVGTSAVTQQLLVTPLASGQPDADESLDKGFVGRCFILGSCWLGPSVMMYQQLAEKTFPGQLWRMVGRKILLDQMTLAPFMITSFFVGMNLLEGNNSASQISEEWKEKFPKAYALGICFWPVVNTVQWRAVPIPARPIWNAVMALIWGNVLCFLKSSREEESELGSESETVI